jgi:hypothetical protein
MVAPNDTGGVNRMTAPLLIGRADRLVGTPGTWACMLLKETKK